MHAVDCEFLLSNHIKVQGFSQSKWNGYKTFYINFIKSLETNWFGKTL